MLKINVIISSAKKIEVEQLSSLLNSPFVIEPNHRTRTQNRIKQCSPATTHFTVQELNTTNTKYYLFVCFCETVDVKING